MLQLQSRYVAIFNISSESCGCSLYSRCCWFFLSYFCHFSCIKQWKPSCRDTLKLPAIIPILKQHDISVHTVILTLLIHLLLWPFETFINIFQKKLIKFIIPFFCQSWKAYICRQAILISLIEFINTAPNHILGHQDSSVGKAVIFKMRDEHLDSQSLAS